MPVGFLCEVSSKRGELASVLAASSFVRCVPDDIAERLFDYRLKARGQCVPPPRGAAGSSALPWRATRPGLSRRKGSPSGTPGTVHELRHWLLVGCGGAVVSRVACVSRGLCGLHSFAQQARAVIMPVQRSAKDYAGADQLKKWR